MIVSYNWLQKYFEKPLPKVDDVVNELTFKAFEIDGVRSVDKDTVIDVKVLPDRAHYALSHRGIAREISAILRLPLHDTAVSVQVSDTSPAPKVRIDDSSLCSRYCARRISSVSVTPSVTEIKELLEVIGQRAINNIVDATNFVMFDVGQPLHAFDADKVIGEIVVRRANKGEKIELLPERIVVENGEIIHKERNIELVGFEIVIADEDGPIALAGIKGGARAAVSADTSSIILESAHFNSALIRKASRVHAIRNDSSKRFENGLTPELAPLAMDRVTALILESSNDAKVGKITDVYPAPSTPRVVRVHPDFISKYLGANVPIDVMEDIFNRLQIDYKDTGSEFELGIPSYRLDLTIPEDVVEEVGRLYGYDKIEAVLPPTKPIEAPQSLYYHSEKIKDVLVREGYSEMYLYTFRNKGFHEVIAPPASDKSYLRDSLIPGMQESLEHNSRQTDLLPSEQVKLFEVGHVFTAVGEKMMLAIGVKSAPHIKKAKDAEEFTRIVSVLNSECGLNLDSKGTLAEWDLSLVTKDLPSPKPEDTLSLDLQKTSFKTISPYPHIGRDIAVFVPQNVSPHELEEIVVATSGPLRVRHSLFDVFEKTFPDGTVKKSYAYRIIFQSHERTLSDDEVNKIMEKMYDEVRARGWEVR